MMARSSWGWIIALSALILSGILFYNRKAHHKATGTLEPGARKSFGPRTEAVAGPQAASTTALTAVPAVRAEPKVSQRDPTLSPSDLAHLEQMSSSKSTSGWSSKMSKSKRATALERAIVLQGIISNAQNSSKAIVNGEMVGVGDYVGKVKIVRIGSKSVVFSYKGKKFTKIIGK